MKPKFDYTRIAIIVFVAIGFFFLGKDYGRERAANIYESRLKAVRKISYQEGYTKAVQDGLSLGIVDLEKFRKLEKQLMEIQEGSVKVESGGEAAI